MIDADREPPGAIADRLRRMMRRHGWVRFSFGADAARHPVLRLEEWLLQVSDCLGAPVPQTAAGALVRQIRDEGRDYAHHATRGHQTRSELAFHSDRCDWILLFYVCPAAAGGEISLVGYEDAARALESADPTALGSLFGDFPFDLREERIFAEGSWQCRPILWRNSAGRVRGHYIRRFIADSQRHADCPRLTADQAATLDRFDAAIGGLAGANRFAPQAGDLLVLDNYRVMHARSAFADGPDSRRLALRTWVAPRDSEPLPEALLPLAGSCLPGVFRGGVGGGADYHARLGRPCGQTGGME